MWVTGGSYQAWAAFLDRFGAGDQCDPSTLPRLAVEDFAGDSWARLMNRITEALHQRLVAWSGTLARELPAARDEFAAARALNHARWALQPVRALAAAPGLPEDVRGKLSDAIETQISSVQKQLEEHVQRMRRAGTPNSAVEARLRTIRDNPMTAATGRSTAMGDGWTGDPTASPRRRVIVD